MSLVTDCCRLITFAAFNGPRVLFVFPIDDSCLVFRGRVRNTSDLITKKNEKFILYVLLEVHTHHRHTVLWWVVDVIYLKD